MTKYYMHGGHSQYTTTQGMKQALLQSFQDLQSPKILDIPFASSEEKRDIKYQAHQNIISEIKSDKNIEIKLASQDIPTFIEQVKWADILYVSGGATAKIYDFFVQVPDFKNLIKGKQVIGSSAGALVFATVYIDNDIQDYIQYGLGILPIKLLIHYQSPIYDLDTEFALNKLDNTGEKMPIYKVKEGEYIIINQD